MGRVYLGVSPGGRPVAVKAIRAELAADPDFRRRFGREVAAARRVSGVFTAIVVDADVNGPVAWMATSYVPGPSLAEAVDQYGPLPEGSLLTLVAGLAESLSAIHAAGVVHRDLKPSNVLLAEDGPRVIDFGISRAAEYTALTQAGLVIGSPGFMSPEQAQGYDVGPASDIFSLGAVLAFAATGQGPFGTGTTASLLYRVVHGTPSLDQVPATVRPLIERCLAKDPRLRPTASGMLAEAGALQPTTNWLPDSIIRAVTRDTVTGASGAVAGAAGAAGPGLALTQTTTGGSSVSTGDSQLLAPAGNPLTAPTGPQPPPPGGAYRQPPRPRPSPWRPAVLAWIIGVLLVASGATAFVLTSFTGHTPTPTSPAADTSSAPVPTSAAPSTPSVPPSSHRASSSASAPSSASVSSSPVYENTSQPASLSTSPSAPPPRNTLTSPPPSSRPPSSPPPSSPPPSSRAPSSPPPSSPPPSSPPPSSPPPSSPPPSSPPPSSPPPSSPPPSNTTPSTPASTPATITASGSASP
jgi:serine/threonine protein kinase